MEIAKPKYDITQFYREGLRIINTYIALDETDAVANCANISSILYDHWNDFNRHAVWVGFYFVRTNDLVLGPFQGRPNRCRFSKSSGIYGEAVMTKQIVAVPDIKQYSSFASLDRRTRSSVAVPIIWNDEVVAVLGIDRSSVDQYSFEEIQGLEDLALIVANSSTWNLHGTGRSIMPSIPPSNMVKCHNKSNGSITDSKIPQAKKQKLNEEKPKQDTVITKDDTDKSNQETGDKTKITLPRFQQLPQPKKQKLEERDNLPILPGITALRDMSKEDSVTVSEDSFFDSPVQDLQGQQELTKDPSKKFKTVANDEKKETPKALKNRNRWSDEETDRLIRGVAQFGVGHWKEIRDFWQLPQRSTVDLKDKWRNLTKWKNGGDWVYAKVRSYQTKTLDDT